MPDTDSNKEVVTKFYSALNEQDRNALVDCFAADGSAWALGSTLVSGRNKISDIAMGIDALLEAFPSGLRFRILDLIAEDDRVSAKVESKGDHASGRVYSNSYHSLFVLRGGKIYEMREYMDTERVTDILCGGERPPQDDARGEADWRFESPFDPGEDPRKAIFVGFIDALSRGDGQFVSECFADDGFSRTLGSTLISGRFSKSEIGHAASSLVDAFPEGLAFTITGMTAEGDQLAVEARSTGRHVSGQLYTNLYHFRVGFRQNEIVEFLEYMDTERVTEILCGGQRPEGTRTT